MSIGVNAKCHQGLDYKGIVGYVGLAPSVIGVKREYKYI